jgi:hypothetical protein
MLLLVALSGCDGEKPSTLPDEEFQQIYGEIILLGELHRSDTARLRLALDSLLEDRGVDTTVLFTTAREIALDAGRSAELYRIVIERFEQQIGRPDTTERKTAPPIGFD